MVNRQQFVVHLQKRLTIDANYDKFTLTKGCDEDTHFRKDSQRGRHIGARLPYPCRRWYHFRAVGAEMPHRVRPLKRQWVASFRMQPGWNRGILLYPTPDTFRGWGFFIPSPHTQWYEIRDMRYEIRDILSIYLISCSSYLVSWR